MWVYEYLHHLQAAWHCRGVCAVVRGVEGFDFGNGGQEYTCLGHEEVFSDGGAAFRVSVEIEDRTVGLHVTVAARGNAVPPVNGQRDK